MAASPALSGPTDFRHHRFHVLDGMRGIAALLVMAFHYSIAEDHSYFHNTSAAVDFFFILSGFVICHAYGRKLREGMTAIDYIARRIARLWPTMALGIAIGAVTMAVSVHAGRSDYSYRDVAVSSLCNLFFIPFTNSGYMIDVRKEVGFLFPVDGALWSIYLEMIASAGFLWLNRLGLPALVRLCGLSLLILFTGSVLNAVTAHSWKLVTETGYNSATMLSGLPRVFYGFTCGLILYRLRAHPALSAWKNRSLIGSTGLYCVLAALLLFPFQVRGLFYFATIVVFAPLLVLEGSRTVCKSRVTLAISEWLGLISFPVYCVHQPVFRGVSLLDDQFPLAPHLGIPVEVAAACVTLALAWPVAALLGTGVQIGMANLLRQGFNALLPQPAR